MVKNQDVIKEFIDFGTDVKVNSVFSDKGVLYSYGYHFPMLVRLNDGYIYNKDKYSPTTSKHQSIVRSYLEQKKISYIEMNTRQIKELLLNPNITDIRFITIEELNKLRILEGLQDEN